MRRLQQPGAPVAERIRHRHAAQARHLRIVLAPGLSLYDALVPPLARAGIRHASITLLGGVLQRAAYCVSVPGQEGGSLLMHGTPIVTGRVRLVTANATLATGTDGAPLLHCHAALQGAQGTLVGGHLLMPQCLLADEGGVARVAGFEGFELRAAFDPETRLPLVQPHG